MCIKRLLVDLEKRGILDSKVSGHTVTRPASVMRGEEADRQGPIFYNKVFKEYFCQSFSRIFVFLASVGDPCRFEISHNEYAVYRPNPVQAKSAKATNLAGLIGYKALEASPHVTLVWRVLVPDCFVS